MRYGIPENTLYRWRDEFMAAGEAALANGRGKADPRQRQLAELKKQLGERDKVIGELTIANRLLKKTADLAIQNWNIQFILRDSMIQEQKYRLQGQFARPLSIEVLSQCRRNPPVQTRWNTM